MNSYKQKFTQVEKLSLAILLYNFVYAFVPNWFPGNFMYYLPYMLSILAIFFLLVERTKSSVPYTIWRGLLLVLCIISLFVVTVSYSDTFFFVKRIVLESIVLFQIMFTVKKIGIEPVLKIFVQASMIAVACLAVVIDYSTILTHRLGDRLIFDSQWNSNEIGIMATYAFLFIELLIRTGEYRRKAYLFYEGLLLLIVVLSGSRTALLAAGLGYIVFFVYDSKDIVKTIRRIITISGLGIIGVVGLFNIPFLYNTIGYRMRSLLDYLNAGTISDGSMYWRSTMNNRGIEFFKQNPIWGHGLNAFGYLFGFEFPEYAVYAHNNYIELLTDAGIIGIVLYYWVFIYAFCLFYRSKRREKGFYIIVIILVLLMDITGVTYIDMITQSVILLMILGLEAMCEKKYLK